MKKILLLLLLISTFGISEGFFNITDSKQTPKMTAQARLCQVFDATAKNYKAKIGNDKLSNAKLASYEKRAKKICNRACQKNIIKNEDARLCKIFNQKAKNYKKVMRSDALAEATLISYEKRAKEFCSASYKKGTIGFYGAS